MTLTNIAVALFLAFLVETLVEHFLGKPLEKQLPTLDRWWLMYVALVVGFAISFFAGLNIFPVDVIPELMGLILTGIIVGGGSQLVHKIIEAGQVVPHNSLDVDA